MCTIIKKKIKIHNNNATIRSNSLNLKTHASVRGPPRLKGLAELAATQENTQEHNHLT